MGKISLSTDLLVRSNDLQNQTISNKPVTAAILVTQEKKSIQRFQWETRPAALMQMIDSASKEKAIVHYENAIQILKDWKADDEDYDGLPKEIAEKALQEIEKAISLNPEYAGFYLFKGACLASLDKLERALTEFNRAVDLDSEFVDCYFDKGDAFLMRAQLKLLLSLKEMFGASLDDLEKAAAMGNANAKEFFDVFHGLSQWIISELMEKITSETGE